MLFWGQNSLSSKHEPTVNFQELCEPVTLMLGSTVMIVFIPWEAAGTGSEYTMAFHAGILLPVKLTESSSSLLLHATFSQVRSFSLAEGAVSNCL